MSEEVKEVKETAKFNDTPAVNYQELYEKLVVEYQKKSTQFEKLAALYNQVVQLYLGE